MLTDDPRTLAQSVQARLSGDILAGRFDPGGRGRGGRDDSLPLLQASGSPDCWHTAC